MSLINGNDVEDVPNLWKQKVVDGEKRVQVSYMVGRDYRGKGASRKSLFW